MSASICLDASVFACPRVAGTPESYSLVLDEFIENIVSLNDRLGSAVVRFLMPRDVPALLANTGRYPFFADIRDALVFAGLADIYQPGDLIKLLEQLLRETTLVEDFVGIAELMADPITVDAPLACAGNQYSQQSHYVPIALGQHIRRLNPIHTWLLAEPADLHVNPVVCVAGTIVEVEWRNRAEMHPTPISINEQIQVQRSLGQVWASVDLGLLKIDLGDESMSEIIKLALHRGDYTGGAVEVLRWSLGAAFCETVRALHFSPANFRRLVATCVETICQTQMDRTHHLRTGPGGNNPQIVIGGAGAWRRDIDREFHLHYWVKGTACEFASCVVHNDFTIPNPR